MLLGIMSGHCKRNFLPEIPKMFIEVIRQNRYLDLGNGSNKFGNHWTSTLK